MRIGMSNKAVTTAPACFRDHPNLAGTTCEQCGMAIPTRQPSSPGSPGRTGKLLPENVVADVSPDIGRTSLLG